MGDDILSHQAVDIYSGLKISPSQYITRKRNGLLSKKRINDPPSHTEVKCRNFAEENVFEVLANQSMLQTEVWKTQMALNDELIAAEVLEREEKQKRAIKYQKLLEEVEKLCQFNRQKEDKIHELIVQNTNLKKNICSLYKTAKSEVEQKNCLLLDANEECDKLRRKLSKMCSFHQSEFESLTPKPLHISRTQNEHSSADFKRKKSEDYKASHKKRKYCDHKEKEKKVFKSKTSESSSARFHKNVTNKNSSDMSTKKSLLHKYESRGSKVLGSKRHLVKNKDDNIKYDLQKVSKTGEVKRDQEKDCGNLKHSELDKITDKKFLKDHSTASVLDESQKGNLVSASCCTDKKPMPVNILSGNSDNYPNKSNPISIFQNIKNDEHKQFGESLLEQNEKLKFLQTLIPNLSTDRKSSGNDGAFAVVSKTENNESHPPSEKDGSNNTTHLHDKKSQTNFLNDKTTTNALFFGLLPKEVREIFLEYEQRLITMIVNLKQNFVDYCLKSTKDTLLNLLPGVINQTFIDYEERLIITTNILKQTFVGACLAQCGKQEGPGSAELYQQMKETLADGDPLLKPVGRSGRLVSSCSRNPVNKPKEEKLVSHVSESNCEKNKATEEILKNQIPERVKNIFLNMDRVCSENDDKNSDSTQKVPSFYREIFLSNEKTTCTFVSQTSLLNSALANNSKDNESVSSKSISLASLSSHSNTVNTKPCSSAPFHPSLSSVYYRRQLLKAAIVEKAEKRLSKSTKENINDLYRYRKTKIPFVSNKRE